MYNPNVPSSNMGIAPISGQPSQPLGPTPMVGPAPMAPMGAPPPMAPPMMGGMPPPPMMAPPPMAPPIAPITEGLGGFGGSSAGRAGFSERMQRMTAPPKPRPMPQPMPIQGMQYGGSVSSQGLSMYQPPMNGGMHRMPDGSMMSNNDPSMGGMPMQQPMMPRPMGMMGGVPNRVEPLRMALGGFIGNPTTREYSYTDPYEELDDLYDDIGGYDPSDPFGDGDPNYGGDDDDRNFGPPVPTPAPPVSPPSGGDDIKDSVVADLVYDSADPTVGPNNAQEAVEQAVAANKLGNLDLADSSLATLASRISRGRDAMPARLSDIAAISQDFAVPEAADTTLSDPDEIFDLRNPISLNSAQVVAPDSRIKADRTFSDPDEIFNTGPEVMSSSPTIGSSGVPLGQLPTSIGGISDSPVVGTNFPPIGARYDVTAGARLNEPEADLTTPITPKMALPGGSALRTANDQELESFNKAMDDSVNSEIAGGGLMSGTPGMQSYLEDYPAGTGGTEFVAPIGTRRNSDGRTVSGIAPSPAPAVIRPQNTKYLSPFDISELENAARDYRETGAGSSDYDPMAAQATAEALKRAEDDVSALDRIAEARMPTDDMQIVDDMRSVPRSSPEFAAPVGDLAQFEPQVRAASSQTATADPSVVPASFTNVDPYEDQSVKDSYYDQLFGDSPKPVQLLGNTLKFLSSGLIDINKLNENQRQKGLEAFAKTNELAYENGVVVGVKDVDGSTIRLGPQQPKERNDTGGDDGCPPGFRRVNGVCQPIDGVSANPADDIADDIEKATMPIIRPLDSSTGDDVTTDPVNDDPAGIVFRRPKYFAGGGAVSEGMGSAIDSFISAMGGSVKKKSNVEPVNMFFGGLVDRFTGRNDYTDPYEELGRDYGYDPTDPFGDGDTSYGDDSPSDTVTADTFIGPMQPNVTYQPPVDTGGDDKRGRMMSFADDLRLTRQETSPFSSIYAANTQLDNDLALQGRRPVLGGILSKEPVAGTDTLRFEGLSGLKNLGVSMMDPIARAIDAPRAAAQNLLPEENMLSEALGTAGIAMGGSSFYSSPYGSLMSGYSRKTPADIDDYIKSLNKRTPISQFQDKKKEMITEGMTGSNLDFALNNLARGLGIERPD